jgi:hypothetical protein
MEQHPLSTGFNVCQSTAGYSELFSGILLGPAKNGSHLFDPAAKLTIDGLNKL